MADNTAQLSVMLTWDIPAPFTCTRSMHYWLFLCRSPSSTVWKMPAENSLQKPPRSNFIFPSLSQKCQSGFSSGKQGYITITHVPGTKLSGLLPVFPLYYPEWCTFRCSHWYELHRWSHLQHITASFLGPTKPRNTTVYSWVPPTSTLSLNLLFADIQTSLLQSSSVIDKTCGGSWLLRESWGLYEYQECEGGEEEVWKCH